jgi:hypothetical protein
MHVMSELISETSLIAGSTTSDRSTTYGFCPVAAETMIGSRANCFLCLFYIKSKSEWLMRLGRRRGACLRVLCAIDSAEKKSEPVPAIRLTF